jgi:hypothetical protein
MARPLLPPKFVAIPADIVYDTSVPAGVFRTYVQLRGLLWGKEAESQEFSMKEIQEVTGLSRSALYGHLGILRDCGWLLSSSTHYSRITIYLHGGAQDAEGTVEKDVDNSVDKPVDNLSKNLDKVSRNLDRSIKEDVKDFKSLPPEFNLPPDYLDNPREETVHKSGQGVQKSGQVSKNLDKHNGWHDVIDRPLEGKLERLGVFPQVYGQVAEAVRSGEWTLEKVKELADDILDLGDSAGPGVFVFRLKNRIRPETAAEKQEKTVEKYRKLYRGKSEVKNGA